MKRQLSEIRYLKSNFEEQDSGNVKKKYIVGEFGIVDTPTENKRIYSRKLIEREIDRLKNRMESRSLVGELDHPDDGKPRLSRVSHLITELYIDDNNIIRGKAEILDTDNGKNLYALAKAGVSIGVSLRGYGSTTVTEDGYELVHDDFELLTFDFVADPAAHSFGMLKENKRAKVSEGEQVMNDQFNQVDVDKIKLVEEYNKKLEESVINVKQEFGDKFIKELDKLAISFKSKLLDTENKLFEAVDVAKKAGLFLRLEQLIGNRSKKEMYYELIDFDKIDDEKDLVSQVEMIKKSINDEYNTQQKSDNVVIDDNMKSRGEGDTKKADDSGDKVSDDIDQLIDKIRELEDIINKLHAENEKLKSKLSDVEVDKSEYDIVISELDKIESDYKDKILDYENAINEMNIKLDKYARDMQVLESKLYGIRKIAFRSDYAKFENDIMECRTKEEVDFIINKIKDIKESREFDERRKKLLETFERKSKINEEISFAKMTDNNNDIGSGDGIQDLKQIGLPVNVIKSMLGK